MPIKSSQTLVSEALSEVKTITADEALKLSSEDKCTLIDIREKGELDKTLTYLEVCDLNFQFYQFCLVHPFL